MPVTSRGSSAPPASSRVVTTPSFAVLTRLLSSGALCGHVVWALSAPSGQDRRPHGPSPPCPRREGREAVRVSPRVLRRAPGVRGPWSAARAWASCAFHQHFASSDPFGFDARLARPGLAVSACRVCALLFLSFAKRSVCPRRRGGGTGLACRRLTGSGRRAVHRTRTLVGGPPHSEATRPGGWERGSRAPVA